MKLTVQIHLDKRWDDVKMKEILELIIPSPKERGITHIAITNVRI